MSQKQTPGPRQNVRDAIEQELAWVREQPGVRGVGEGEEGGEPFVVVLTHQAPPSTRQAIEQRLSGRGVAVRFREAPAIRPYGAGGAG